jgi:lysophospholipase L1-like esterase
MTPRPSSYVRVLRSSTRAIALAAVAGTPLAACSGNTSSDGDSGSGGSTAAAGSSAGGAAQTGGQADGGRTSGGAGGTVAGTGGSHTAGSGGSAPTGGAADSGGTPASGGVGPDATAGSVPTGGTAAGGAATGGVPTGGRGVGGLGRGGVSTGGRAGDSTGGVGTGGAPTGGADSGGASGAPTVWIAGDSTVANGNTPCPVGWGKHFDELFDDRVTVVNSAVGGRSVRTWLYSVQTVMDPATNECVLDEDASGKPILQDRWQAMLDGMKPGDYLLIQFGINDGSATCDRHVGLNAFKESYGMMAKAAQDRGAQPVFLTPTAAIGCSGSTAIGTRGSYVTATVEAGATYDVPVIELHQLTVNLYNSLGFCPVPGGDVSASTTGPVGDFFCDDHTHFSDSGAVQIAGLVAKALRDQGLGLATYLK